MITSRVLPDRLVAEIQGYLGSVHILHYIRYPMNIQINFIL